MTGIIIFGLVALFLGLRLYSVLGKRTGHEQSFGHPEDATVPPLPAGTTPDEARDRAPFAEAAEQVVENGATAGVRAIAASDRQFSPEQFVDGAKAAYRMILEAYWKGDLSEVEGFVAEDVRAAFAEAVEARVAAGETLDNRLINIERAVIANAELERGWARITVRFDADIAAVTRNKEGSVIAGSLSDAVPTHDSWVFSREMRAADPNWILTDTDEAS